MCKSVPLSVTTRCASGLSGFGWLAALGEAKNKQRLAGKQPKAMRKRFFCSFKKCLKIQV
jgi:hypothetical protein